MADTPKCRFAGDKEVYDADEGEDVIKSLCRLVAYDPIAPFECNGEDPNCSCYSPLKVM